MEDRKEVENKVYDCHPWTSKAWLLSGKVLARFCDLHDILHIDSLHECCTINTAYFCELLSEIKLAYH